MPTTSSLLVDLGSNLDGGAYPDRFVGVQSHYGFLLTRHLQKSWYSKSKGRHLLSTLEALSDCAINKDVLRHGHWSSNARSNTL